MTRFTPRDLPTPRTTVGGADFVDGEQAVLGLIPVIIPRVGLLSLLLGHETGRSLLTEK